MYKYNERQTNLPSENLTSNALLTQKSFPEKKKGFIFKGLSVSWNLPNTLRGVSYILEHCTSETFVDTVSLCKI